MDEHGNTEPGTAFPIVHPDGRGVQYFGLSMRDYYAAKAMQAMVNSGTYETGGRDQRDIAIQSYQMADAMLAERTK